MLNLDRLARHEDCNVFRMDQGLHNEAIWLSLDLGMEYFVKEITMFTTNRCSYNKINCPIQQMIYNDSGDSATCTPCICHS